MLSAIVSGYRFVYFQLAAVVGYGWAIVALSFICSFLMSPLMRAVSGVVRRESEYQSVILPQIEIIKAKYPSDRKRHHHIQRLYARYSYTPLSAIKKVLPLIVQIPFLLLTYYMLKGTGQLSGVTFAGIGDLGLPDNLIRNVGMLPVELNLLPILMTLINGLTVFATPGFSNRDRFNAVFIAFLFLALLYGAPSSLLLFWTLNNAITLFRTLLAHRCEGARLLMRMVCQVVKVPYWIGVEFSGPRGGLWMAFALIVAVYLRIVVFLQIGWFNTLASYWLMVPALSLCSFIWLLRPFEKGRLERSSVMAIVFCGIALLVFAASVLITPRLVAFIMHSLSLKNLFDALLVVFTIAVVKNKLHDIMLRIPETCCRLLSRWPLWMIVVAFAVHYSLSSRDFQLSIFSSVLLVCLLFGSCLLLCVLVLICGWREKKDVLMDVVIGAFIGMLTIPMVSLGTGKILGWQSNLCIRVLLMFIGAGAAYRCQNRRLICVFSCLFLLCVVVHGYTRHYHVEVRHNQDEGAMVNVWAPEITTNTVKNNVYLLIYDSYAHDIVLSGKGIKCSRIQDILVPRGFVRYDAYSEGCETLASMSAAFSFGKRRGSQRSMISGDNVFCDILHSMGYRLSYALCGYLMPNKGEPKPGDYYYPPAQQIMRPELVLYRNIAVGFLSQTAESFNTYTQEEWVAAKRKIISEVSSSANFIYAHSELPSHGTTNPIFRDDDRKELADYERRLKEADCEIDGDVDLILNRDPSAIVIVASDHGPYLTMPKRSAFDARHLLDRCGIQLYVKWPGKRPSNRRIQTLHNALVEVLVSITGDRRIYRFWNDGATQPFMYPIKTSAGFIRNGVIMDGREKGCDLFNAAMNDFTVPECLD